jgi:hypothetical protein
LRDKHTILQLLLSYTRIFQKNFQFKRSSFSFTGKKTAAPHAEKTFLFLFFCLCSGFVYSQVFDLADLTGISQLPKEKFNNMLLKKGFAIAGKTESNGDTVAVLYRPAKQKGKPADSVIRYVTRLSWHEDYSVSYNTSSYEEFASIRKQMKQKGYYCSNESDSAKISFLLYQHADMTIAVSTKKEDSLVCYSLNAYKKEFPAFKELYYADDLLTFSSHEYLEHYFGKENVKKDVYYFVDERMMNCSVLFANSPRQLVFVWKDAVNRCGIASMLLGGQHQPADNSQEKNYVAENKWLLKSGLHAGMPLYELRMLNGENFKYHGAGSPSAGYVLTGQPGKIDFDRHTVLLSCVNCSNDQFPGPAAIDADDAIAEGKIVFVLSVTLNAEKKQL